MITDKYDIPSDWKRTCDAYGCCCGAGGWFECACDDVDWTPSGVYELRIEVNALRAENNALRMEPK